MSSEAMEIRDAAGSYVLKAKQDVPAGYKRTEVGVIPEGWNFVTVDQVADVKGGKRLPTGYYLTDVPTSHPYIRVSDMRPGGIDLEGIKYVPDGAYPAIQNYRIYGGDIFISVAGTLGIVGVIPSQLNGANLTENADRITNLQCDRDYLMYWLMSSPIQKAIDAIRTVGAQPKLALGRIAKFTIAIPSKREEQRAIATALSDVDALITALDKLIAKKRAIKTAAMQQLLTGKTRLPGFSGEWDTKQLGELGVFLKGSNVNREEAQSGAIPCVRYGELYTVHNDVIRTFSSWISREIAEKAVKIRKGDVLFAGSGETKEEIGKCASFLDDFEAYAGGDIVILRPTNDVDSVYLGYALNVPGIARQKAARGQGDAVVHISARALSDIVLNLPTVEEQSAIAQVLSDMDAEIAALEARRDKTRAIKQGMMQQLLTGRVRLVKPGSKEAA